MNRSVFSTFKLTGVFTTLELLSYSLPYTHWLVDPLLSLNMVVALTALVIQRKTARLANTVSKHLLFFDHPLQWNLDLPCVSRGCSLPSISAFQYSLYAVP